MEGLAKKGHVLEWMGGEALATCVKSLLLIFGLSLELGLGYEKYQDWRLWGQGRGLGIGAA